MAAAVLFVTALAGCGSAEISSSHDTAQSAAESTVLSESSAAQPSAPEPIINYDDGSYTLMIYMCGSSLETRSGYATKNITEMLSAELPESTRVIIQTGGADKWRKYDISSAHSSRYEIKDGELCLIEQGSPVNMGEPSSLSDFLMWGEENYPAEKRGVILWDHGGGSMRGVCSDQQFSGDSLTLPELKTAFEEVFAASGRKYDFVGFDACLMATYDMACVLEPFADYMIASEELEPSSGWDYKTLVSSLGKDSFCVDVLNGYAAKHSKKATYTLSAADLSKLSSAKDVVQKITHHINFDLSNVGPALSGSKEFGSKDLNSGGTSLYDLGQLADNLGIEHGLSDFITSVNGSAHEEATGMTLYFPTDCEELVDEYAKVSQDEDYTEFLYDYFSYTPDEPVVFSEIGINDDGQYFMTLSDTSLQYVRSVGYALFTVDPEAQKIYCIGTDNDVTASGNTFTVEFDGGWAFLGDMLLHTNVIEEKDSYTIFSAPVMVNGELAYLVFAYFGQSGSLSVDGYYLMDEDASRIHELKNGDEIAVVYTDPASDEPHTCIEGTAVWGEDALLSVRKLVEGKYQYMPYILDIYDDLHYSAMASVYFDGKSITMNDIVAE